MQKMLWTCALSALILTLVAVAAEEAVSDTQEPERPPEVQVDLPGLIRLGMDRSPRIKAARAQWQATIERIPQARSLPDPMVMFDVKSDGTRVDPQEYRVGVSQSFPWPGTLGQAGDVAARDVRIRHAEYEQAIRDLIVDLKISYSELLYLRGALSITRQNEALVTHILKLAMTEYGAGNAKLNDVLRAQSQVAQLGYDAILLRELEQVEIAAINALLDRPTTQAIGEASMPQVELVQLTVEELEAVAVARRQEVEVAQGRIDKSEEEIRLASLQNRPRFTLSASRSEMDEAAMDNSKDTVMVGIGVSIPLWFDRNRSRVREAEYKHEAAVQNKRTVENQTRSQVKSIYFRLENARRLIELYDKSLIPQARQAMAISEQWHDGETRDISGFLETQSVWLNFNLARLRAVTDYQQYLARLERLLGGAVPDQAPEREDAE